MKRYFYTDGKQRFGPFTFEELSRQNIGEDTLVWREGMEGWTPLKEVGELAGLFPPEVSAPAMTPAAPAMPARTAGASAPGTPKPAAVKVEGIPPKSWLVESILVTIFCCLPVGIAAIMSASKVESSFYEGNSAKAADYAKTAKQMVTISFWGGLAVVIFVVIAAIFTDTYEY